VERGSSRARRLGFVAAVVVAVAGGLGFWAWSRALDRDEQAVRTREGAAARAALARWLARTPDAPAAQLWRARFALADRAFPEADAALQRARALHAPADELRRVSAIADALVGHFAESEPLLRQAFNEDPTPDPLLDEALARVYLETYDLQRAGVALKRWMRDAPRDAKPYLWRVEIDTRLGDARAVEADYRAALARDPTAPKARLGLADCLRQAHKNADAANEYAAYLTLKPDDPAGQLGAGRNAAELGDADAARLHLERAAALASDSAESHRVLADVLTRRGAFADALKHYNRAVALDPYDLEARHGRGLVFARLDRPEEARADQAEATRLRADLSVLTSAQAKLVKAPRDREAQLVVTRWLFDHGKSPEAIRWAESILRDQPDQPEVCRLLADHYQRIGQIGLANYYRARVDTSATAPRKRDARR
jgi:tetratricopeptide (TPR) repeat protein